MLQDGIKARGFFRIQVTEEGEVVGDSGWRENTIVNLGFNDYLVRALAAITGSKQVTHMGLGTGTAPGETDTSLDGELEARAAVTAATSSSSKAAQFTATFASSASFATAAATIQNLGLFNTISGGSLFAGNTFATSAVATDQNVNATYTITFS
jgi:hypothetical protein